MNILPLRPGEAPLSLWRAVHQGASVALDESCWPLVEASHQALLRAARGNDAVYGVNTGFGKLASIRIPAEKLKELQVNLVRSHCAGMGPPLEEPVVRLVMALKAASLAQGASGVQAATIRLLVDMLRLGVLPVIPAQGSVGASGDLAPLAHLSAVLIGEGEAFVAGRRLPGGEALASAGLHPVELGPKEGLALLNGTQVSTALALDGSSASSGASRRRSSSARSPPTPSWARTRPSAPRSTPCAGMRARSRSARRSAR